MSDREFGDWRTGGSCETGCTTAPQCDSAYLRGMRGEDREMINRERERGFVVEKFREKGAQLVILWGRRRVGKTYLLKEFCSQYPAIYFLAVKSSEKDQLFQLSEAIVEFFNDGKRGLGSRFSSLWTENRPMENRAFQLNRNGRVFPESQPDSPDWNLQRFINFWFRFVRPNLRHLEMEKIDFVWQAKMSFSLIWGREGRVTSKSSQERKKWDMAKMDLPLGLSSVWTNSQYCERMSIMMRLVHRQWGQKPWLFISIQQSSDTKICSL